MFRTIPVQLDEISWISGLASRNAYLSEPCLIELVDGRAIHPTGVRAIGNAFVDDWKASDGETLSKFVTYCFR